MTELSILLLLQGVKPPNRLAQLKNILVELTARNINFVGYTGSDIPLGWSYPILETDVANMYNLARVVDKSSNIV